MRLIDGGMVWRLHATEGMPLELTIPLLATRGVCPTWWELIQAAVKDGMRRDRIIDRLQGEPIEMYAPEDRAAIHASLEKLRTYAQAG